jgi:hypothetical protein
LRFPSEKWSSVNKQQKCTRINRELFRRSMTGKPLSAGSPMLHRWGGTPRLHFPCSWSILLERSPGRSRLWGFRLHQAPLGHPLCPRWIESWKLSRVSHWSFNVQGTYFLNFFFYYKNLE